MNAINNFHRDLVIERYVDDIVGSLDFLETKEKLKDCLLKQKHDIPDDDLEVEIMRHNPRLFDDIYFEELFEEVSNA